MQYFFSSKTQAGQGTSLLTLMLTLLLLFASISTTVMAGIGGGTTHRYGAVFTRGVIMGPSNQPIYVEYEENGAQGSEIGEAVGPLAHAHVMATAEYRAYLAQLAQLQTQYPGLELVTKSTYDTSAYYTPGGELIKGVRKAPRLADTTVTAALRPLNQRLSTDPEQLVLLELPIDPSLTPKSDSRSLLLDKTSGAVLWDSRYNIGYKTGFGTDAEGNETGGDFHDTQQYHGALSKITIANTLGHATTDKTGRYGLDYPLPPCPGFYYKLENDLYAELYYKRFNPRGETAPFPYYLKRDNQDTCNGLDELVGGITAAAIKGILASSASVSTVNELNFIVDMMVLAGQARLGEPAKVGPDTRYSATRSTLTRVAQSQYDFDGDAQPDKAVLGRIVTDTDPNTGQETQRFEALTAAQNPELQGVWLSSRHDLATLDTTTTLPDLTRLADWSADFADRGLLSQITLDDLRNTDLFVFRESDGSLITERHGLKDSEFSDIFLGVSSKSGTFHYTIDIVGALEGIMNDFGYTTGGQYKQWQISGQMNPKFYQRRADHLRPGEQVRIVAINRATGYTGSITTEMKAAGSSGSTGEISFPIEDIVLGPPNLKVWAERTSKVDFGLTKGSIKEQAIGNEGAGLTDDTLITIYTEWLDHDGRPLPEALADHGYTGRLAKVIAPNVLGAVNGTTASNNKLSQFAIKPGRQTQVIRLPEKVLGEQHLYVQVSGEPISQKPDFSTSGLAENGILQYRPDHYVPFKTPIFDEGGSLLQQQAYKAAKAEFDAGNLTIEPKKPEPFYQWVYRPEFQFSVYDLAMEEIRRTDVDNNTENLLDIDVPVLTSSDQLLDLFYDLMIPEHDPLTPYSYEGDRELVLAFGAEEITATIGENQQISFDDLDVLSSLDTEDYLTITLYSNNDAGNLLWEWAFEFLSLYTPEEDEDLNAPDEVPIYFLSADDPNLTLDAALIGYDNRPPEKQKVERTFWEVDGSGSVIYPMLLSDTGFFRNTVQMPPLADASAIVSAKLEDKTQNSKAQFQEIVVVPGKPGSISLQQSGTAAIRDVGSITVTATVRDSHGNLVTDGTYVDFQIIGDAYIADKEALTEAGVATATIKGGYFSGSTNKVLVSAGLVSSELTFTIEPLSTRFVTPPSSVEAGTHVPLTVEVTGFSGVIEGVPVDVAVSQGRLTQSSLRTDASGRLVLDWETGGQAGTADLLVCTDGQTCLASNTVTLVPPPSETIPGHHLMVGDASMAGSVTVTRYDNANVTFSYSVDTNIPLQGVANTTQNITLGGLIAPNRLPLMDLPLHSLQYNQTLDIEGLPSATLTQVTVAADHPLGVGYSHRIETDGYIEIADDPQLATNESGFHLAIKPESAGGTIFNHQGAQLLILTADGRLNYSVVTDSGTYTVQSDPLTIGQWVNVGARLANGQLELQIDGTLLTPVAAPGFLQYDGAQAIRLGEGFTGWMSQMVLYDPASSPLLLFTGDVELTTVTYDGAGNGTVYVKSTGQQADRPVQQIALVDGTTHLAEVSLTGSSALASTLRLWSTTSVTSPTMAQMTELVGGQGRYGDTGYAAERIVEKVADTSAYSRTQALMAELQALETLPEGRPLIPHIRELQDWFSLNNGEAVLHAAAEHVGDAIKQSLKRDNSALNKLRLPLLVLAEMTLDEPAGAQWIADSTRSKKDFEAWLKFLSLPAEGWVGIHPPSPDVDQVCGTPVPMMDVGGGFMLPGIPCRLTGKRAGLTIIQMTDASLSANPQELIAVVDHFLDYMPFIELVWRPYLFQTPSNSPQITFMDQLNPIGEAHAALPAVAPLLAVIGRVGLKLSKEGAKNLAFFLMGRSNSRINPVVLVASVLYLESRMMTGQCADCMKIVDEDIKKAIDRLIVKILFNVAYAGKLADDGNRKGTFGCRIWSSTHGAAYELLMAAYFHMRYELGDKEYEIIDLQRRAEIVISKEDSMGKRKDHTDYTRYFDIVLKGGDDDNQPILVELKSLSAHRSRNKSVKSSTLDRRWQRWSVAKRIQGQSERTSYHRQLLLDAIASTSNITEKQTEGSGGTQQFGSNFQWFFQDWEPPKKAPVKYGRDPGVPLTKAVLYKSGGKSAFNYVRSRAAELGNGRTAADVLKDNIDEDFLATVTIVNGTDTREEQRLILDGSSGFDSRPRFYRFNLMNEAKTGLKGEFKDLLLEVLPEDIQEAVEKAEVLQETAQRIEDHKDAALEWLRSKTSWLPDFGDDAERYKRKLDEIQQGAEDKIDEIADEVAEAIDEVIPEDLRLEDTCL
jgi:hypothetical protein